MHVLYRYLDPLGVGVVSAVEPQQQQPPMSSLGALHKMAFGVS